VYTTETYFMSRNAFSVNLTVLKIIKIVAIVSLAMEMKLLSYKMMLKYFPILYFCVYSRCYATIVRWAVIPDPFLGHGSVNTFRQQGKTVSIREWCYLRGPRRGVIKKKIGST
jgi:hypothetical protein